MATLWKTSALILACFAALLCLVSDALDPGECTLELFEDVFIGSPYQKGHWRDQCWTAEIDAGFDFQELFQSRRPVLLKNAASVLWPHWEQRTEKWQRESLIRHKGSETISVRVTETEDIDLRYRGIPSGEEHYKKMTVNEFFEDKSSSHLYWDNAKIREFDADFEVDPGFDQFLSERVADHRQWVARSNISATIHYDPEPNLMLVLEGSKTFYMADMMQSKNLYVNFEDNANAQWCKANLFAPDLDKHPLVQNVKQHVCRAEVGDILFVPSYWWHFVRSEPSAGKGGSVIAINWFFEDTPGGGTPAQAIQARGCNLERMLGSLADASVEETIDACDSETRVDFISQLTYDADIMWIEQSGVQQKIDVLKAGRRLTLTSWPHHKLAVIDSDSNTASFFVSCSDQELKVTASMFEKEL